MWLHHGGCSCPGDELFSNFHYTVQSCNHVQIHTRKYSFQPFRFCTTSFTKSEPTIYLRPSQLHISQSLTPNRLKISCFSNVSMQYAVAVKMSVSALWLFFLTACRAGCAISWVVRKQSWLSVDVAAAWIIKMWMDIPPRLFGCLGDLHLRKPFRNQPCVICNAG